MFIWSYGYFIMTYNRGIPNNISWKCFFNKICQIIFIYMKDENIKMTLKEETENVKFNCWCFLLHSDNSLNTAFPVLVLLCQFYWLLLILFADISLVKQTSAPKAMSAHVLLKLNFGFYWIFWKFCNEQFSSIVH